MAQALKSLPENVQAQVQPLFITIDPERDTAEILKKYVALFDKRMIGLTGSVAQIDAVKKTYKVYAAKVPAENGAKDEYTMDHSSYIYLMTPDDQLAKIFKTEDNAASVAAGIQEFIR
jgi:protein SCO1/2